MEHAAEPATVVYVPCWQIVSAVAPDPPGPDPEADQPTWAAIQDFWPASARLWVRGLGDGIVYEVDFTRLVGTGSAERAGCLAVGRERPRWTAPGENGIRSNRKHNGHYDGGDVKHANSEGEGGHVVFGLEEGYERPEECKASHPAYISVSLSVQDPSKLF